MTTRRRLIASATAALASASLSRLSFGQGDAARIVVGFPPGGALDIVARGFAEAMRAPLGRNVLVENRSGAGGAIAVQAVAAANADGNTILLCPSAALTLRPHIDTTLGVDPERQLAPVGTACEYITGLAIGPASPAKTLREFASWCKENPQLASYGSPGVGTAAHLIAALYAHEASIPLVHIPYRGGPQAMADLYGGRLPAISTALSNLTSPHQKGTIRILATTASQRIDKISGVPTFAEEGYPGLTLAEWFGFFVPTGTPSAVVESINKAARIAVSDESNRKLLAKAEFIPRASTVAELGSMVKADSAHWKAVLQRLGIKRQKLS